MAVSFLRPWILSVAAHGGLLGVLDFSCFRGIGALPPDETGPMAVSLVHVPKDASAADSPPPQRRRTQRPPHELRPPPPPPPAEPAALLDGQVAPASPEREPPQHHALQQEPTLDSLPGHDTPSAEPPDERAAPAGDVGDQRLPRRPSSFVATGSREPARGIQATRVAEPSYPRLSRLAGEEGTVEVGVRVDTYGRVTDCFVARSSGHDRLDQAAVAAAKQSTFVPARRRGCPVVATAKVMFEFRLD